MHKLRVQESCMDRPLVLSPDVRTGTVRHPQIESSTFHNNHWDRSPRRHLSAVLAASTNFAVREHRFQFLSRSKYRSYRACSSQQSYRETFMCVDAPVGLRPVGGLHHPTSGALPKRTSTVFCRRGWPPPPFMNHLPKKSSLFRNARNPPELHDVQGQKSGRDKF